MNNSLQTIAPDIQRALDEVRARIVSSKQLHVAGGKSKTGLHCEGDIPTISSLPFQGIVSYDPQEFVITVLAGTTVSDVIQWVSSQGQYLPFDPLLSARGATIGGTIASNASGPGRFRFGGVRDFLLGVRFLDGRGIAIRGGGQVVKNAAGFDYPKLMVGSLGQFGFLFEATFKVFPKPESFATFMARFRSLNDALHHMHRIATSQLDVESLDLIPSLDPSKYDLAIRIGGIRESIEPRLNRIQRDISNGQVLLAQDDESFWNEATQFSWMQQRSTLYKCPIQVAQIAPLEKLFQSHSISRRYSVGGNLLWWESPNEHPTFAEEVGRIAPGLAFLDQSGTEFKPRFCAGPFGQAIKRAFDPESKFA